MSDTAESETVNETDQHPAPIFTLNNDCLSMIIPYLIGGADCTDSHADVLSFAASCRLFRTLVYDTDGSDDAIWSKMRLRCDDEQSLNGFFIWMHKVSTKVTSLTLEYDRAHYIRGVVEDLAWLTRCMRNLPMLSSLKTLSTNIFMCENKTIAHAFRVKAPNLTEVRLCEQASERLTFKNCVGSRVYRRQEYKFDHDTLRLIVQSWPQLRQLAVLSDILADAESHLPYMVGVNPNLRLKLHLCNFKLVSPALQQPVSGLLTEVDLDFMPSGNTIQAIATCTNLTAVRLVLEWSCKNVANDDINAELKSSEDFLLPLSQLPNLTHLDLSSHLGIGGRVAVRRLIKLFEAAQFTLSYVKVTFDSFTEPCDSVVAKLLETQKDLETILLRSPGYNFVNPESFAQINSLTKLKSLNLNLFDWTKETMDLVNLMDPKSLRCLRYLSIGPQMNEAAMSIFESKFRWVHVYFS